MAAARPAQAVSPAVRQQQDIGTASTSVQEPHTDNDDKLQHFAGRCACVGCSGFCRGGSSP